MTDKQPEALRLAEEFEATKSYLGAKAAAELRRLHEAREACERQYQEKAEEVIRLMEVNAELVEALHKIARTDYRGYVPKGVSIAVEALRKAQGDNNAAN